VVGGYVLKVAEAKLAGRDMGWEEGMVRNVILNTPLSCEVEVSMECPVED
jgi:hypothetical protein